jgi:phosphoribosyl-AMP cyclohydrolase
MEWMTSLVYNEQGLIPAVIQDVDSKQVLTLCYMTKEALEQSLAEGKVYVFRRSKGRLMLKGETSGHIQTIQEVYIDCDGKSLVLAITQHVAGCHMGYFTCYYRKVTADGETEIIDTKRFDPDQIYKSSDT